MMAAWRILRTFREMNATRPQDAICNIASYCLKYALFK